MPRHLPAAASAVAMALTLAACSPTFNWREVRDDKAGLRAMLPCKPDTGARRVPMAGREVDLAVLGCDAGGATFAVLWADIGDATRVGEVLDQWRRATLANMRAGAPRQQPFVPPGGLGLRESLTVAAEGQRADGTPVHSRAAYFARGTRVYQAVIYAPAVDAVWADPFFAGLALQ